MGRSARSSTGVLGPLGLLLVAVLWLIIVSGNPPTENLAAPVAPSERVDVDEGGRHAGGLPHPMLTTKPATAPAVRHGT